MPRKNYNKDYNYNKDINKNYNKDIKLAHY